MVGTDTWTKGAVRWVCQKKAEGRTNLQIVDDFKRENPRWVGKRNMTEGTVRYIQGSAHVKFYGVRPGGKDCVCRNDTENPENQFSIPNSDSNDLIDPRLQQISNSRTGYASPANSQSNQIDDRNGSPSGSGSRESPRGMPEARMISEHPQHSEPNSNHLDNQDAHGEVTQEQSLFPTSFGPIYPGAYPAPTEEVPEANEQRKQQQAYHQAQAKRMRESISGRTPIIDLKMLNQAQQRAIAGNYTEQGRGSQPSDGVSQQCGTNVAFTEPHLAQQEMGFPPHTQRVDPIYQNGNYNDQNHGAATQFGSGGLYGPHIDSLLACLPHGGQGVSLTREQQEQLLNMKHAASNRNVQLGLAGVQSSQHQQALFTVSQNQNSPLTSAQLLDLQQQKIRLQSQNNNGLFSGQGQQYSPSQAASKSSPGKAKRKRSPSKAAANATPTAPSSTATTNHTPAVQNSASPALNIPSPAMNRRLSSAQGVSLPNPNMVHSLSQGGPIDVKLVFGRITLQPDQELYVEREGKLAKLKEVLNLHPELHVAFLGSRVDDSNGQHTPQTISSQQGPRPVSTTLQAAPQQFQNGPAKQVASYSEQFLQQQYFAKQHRERSVKQAFALRQMQAQIASPPAIQKQAWAQMQAQIASQPPIQRVQAASHDLSSVISGLPQHMPRNPLTSLPQAAYGLIAQTLSQPSKSFLMPSPGLSSPHTPQQGASTPQSSYAAATTPQKLPQAQLDRQVPSSPPVPQDPQQIQRSTKRPREETSENTEQPAKRLKAPNRVENNAMVSEAPVTEENTVTVNGANAHVSLPQGDAATGELPDVPDFNSGFYFGSFDLRDIPDLDFDSQDWATSPTVEAAPPTEESNTVNSTQVEQPLSPRTHTPEPKDQGASVVQGASADEGASVHRGASDAPQMTAEEHSTTVAPGGDPADCEDQEVFGSQMDNGREGMELEDEDDPIRKVFEDFMREHPQYSMDDHFPGVWGEDVESPEDSDFGAPTAPEDRAPSPEVALQQINWDDSESSNAPKPSGDLTIGIKQEDDEEFL